MKNLKSNLFEKFKDSALVNESLSLVEGGLAGPGSDSTGDTDCTNRAGSGADCGDGSTDAVFDSDPTNAGDDGCRVTSGISGGVAQVNLSFKL